MKRYIFTFSFIIFISISSFACLCGGPQTFCGFVHQDFSYTDLIVKGKKIRSVEHGFEFEISKIYCGEETKETIMVWGDNGFMCRYYSSRFMDGEEYYLALLRLFEDTENFWPQTDPVGSFEQEGDYALVNCGKSYWHQSDETSGDETEAQVESCLAEIYPDCKAVSSITEIELCGISVSEPFPNPAIDRVFINLPERQNLTKGTARIFDDCGKLVRQYDNLSMFHNANLCHFETNGLAAGLYFVQIDLPELCESKLTKRILVRR